MLPDDKISCDEFGSLPPALAYQYSPFLYIPKVVHCNHVLSLLFSACLGSPVYGSSQHPFTLRLAKVTLATHFSVTGATVPVIAIVTGLTGRQTQLTLATHKVGPRTTPSSLLAVAISPLTCRAECLHPIAYNGRGVRTLE